MISWSAINNILEVRKNSTKTGKILDHEMHIAFTFRVCGYCTWLQNTLWLVKDIYLSIIDSKNILLPIDAKQGTEEICLQMLNF